MKVIVIGCGRVGSAVALELKAAGCTEIFQEKISGAKSARKELERLKAQIGVGDPQQGVNYTLSSITAVVLGGTSLKGGRGTFIGTAIGHSIVHRHSADTEKLGSWSLIPMTSWRGVGIGIQIETGSR